MTKRELTGVTRDVSQTTTETTVNYKLPLWQGEDVTSWMTQMNDAMDKIDSGMYAAQNKADNMQANVDEAIAKGNEAIGLYDGLEEWQKTVEDNVDQSLKDSALAKGEAEQAVTAVANANVEIQALQELTDQLQEDVMKIGKVQVIDEVDAIMFDDDFFTIISRLTVYQVIGGKKYGINKCFVRLKNSIGPVLAHIYNVIGVGSHSYDRSDEFRKISNMAQIHGLLLPFTNTNLYAVSKGSTHDYEMNCGHSSVNFYMRIYDGATNNFSGFISAPETYAPQMESE